MRASALKRLAGDRRGMTTVEYVIALCLVGAVSVGMWKSFGENIRSSGSKANTLLRDYLQVPHEKAPLGSESGG